MVAIVTGNGLGLEKTSANILGAQGQIGSAGLGRANDGVFVNAANGNLVVNNRDELLIGRGPDSAINRTYNSLGQFTDDNGDNWANYYSRVVDHVGAINAAGSYLDRLEWDGGKTRYTFDASRGQYVSKDGAGAFDVIGYDGASWWWQDGNTGVKEVYGAAYMNRVVSKTDRDGNAITYSYASASGPLSRITTADGNYTDFNWAGNNLISLTTTFYDTQTGQTKLLTRARYSYDGYNRLSQVKVDLSPTDSTVDGREYVTTYQYVGTSKLVQYITQTDGTQLQIGYDASNRVTALTQTVENGVTRTTSFSYGAGYTYITDAQGSVTTMYFDGAGQLNTLREPEAVAGGNPKITSFGYDGNGNVTTIFTYDGWTNHGNGVAQARDWYRYDANGNVYDRYQQVEGGYIVTRYTYNAQNKVLTESSYASLDADGHGGAEPANALTTRYVYDSEGHLRFRISPEGRVTEYLYDGSAPQSATTANGVGQMTSVIDYNNVLYSVGGLAESQSPTEAQLMAWRSVGTMPDKTNIVRTDTTYDFRGNISTVTTYPQTDSNGNGYGAYSRTTYVYDQHGLLLSKLVNDGSLAETYAYDGMGRTIRFTDAKGVGTWTTYIDSQNRTVVTLANGLTQTSSYNRAGELVAMNEIEGGFVTEFAQSSSLGNWGVGGLTAAAAGQLDGAPATIYTVPAGSTWSGVYTGFNFAAGESVTMSLSLRATAGSSTTQYLGLYDNSVGWGNGNVSSARIISGPGTIVHYTGGLWRIDNLSTTEPTRIEITRNYTAAGSGGAYTYVDLGGSFRAGQSLTLGAPTINKSAYAETDATAGLNGGQFDINNWGVGGATKTAAASLDSGATAAQFTVQATGQWTGVSTGFTANAGDTITAAVNLKAVGAGNSASFGIYGNTTSWGYGFDATSTAKIVSGPGTLTQEVGGLWNITGLSATETTRIEITRALLQNETGGVYLYPERPNGWIAGRAIIAGATSVVRTAGATTTYKYDSLGQARIKMDQAGKRTFYFYDKAGRRIAEVAADGAVTENKYDGNDRVIATVQYATTLSAGQLATLFDGYGAPTAVEFASIRPAASTADRWGWNVYDFAGRLVETIDAAGVVTAFQYDGDNRITKTTKYANAIAATTINGANGVSGYRTAPPTTFVQAPWDGGVDRSTRNFYDKDGLLIGALDSDAYLTEFVYDKAGRRVESIRYWNAASTSYIPVGAFSTVPPGDFAAVKASVALSAAYDAHDYVIYDGRGLIAATIDGEGNVTRFTYDARGNVAQEVRGQKVTPNTAYTLATLPAASGQLQTTNMVRNGVGQVSSQTRLATSGNMTSTFAYNSVGNLTSAVDARGNQSYRYYDARGRLVREEVPTDLAGGVFAVTRYEYDSRGNVVKTIDARGNVSYNYYDDRSRLILQIDAEGYATRTNYNVFGEVASVSRYYQKATGTGSTWTVPTTPTHGQDATTSFTRDSLGRVTATTDAQGATESVYLNAFGEKYYSVNKLGGGTSYSYTRRGLLYYEYNNQLVTRNDGSTQASGAYTKLYHYNARGNVSLWVEGYGLTERRDTTYTYDRAGRLITKTLPSVAVLNTATNAEPTYAPTETYKYDARGNLIESVDAVGARTLFYYDEANRKIAEIIAVTSTIGTHKTFIYDLNGNVTIERVYGGFTTLPTTAGGTAPVPNGAAREIRYAYDRANRLVEKRIPSVLKGELVGTVYQRSTADLVTNYIYDAQGNMVREIDGRGNSIFHYYDKNGREIAKVDQENFLTSWTRDSEGNVLEERRYATAYGATPAVGTLPAVGTSSSDRVTTFTYDKMGRRLTETRLAVAASNVSGNSVFTSAQNATITYTYNAFGEVTSKTEAVGDRTDYWYDAYGRMIAKIDPTFVNHLSANVRLITNLYYDGLNNLVYERPSEYNTGADARSNRYIYGAGGRLTQMIDTAGFARNYYYDAAGRVARERYTRVNSLGQNIREDREKTYDLAGRVTGEKVNSYNESTGVWTYGQSATTTYNAYGDAETRGINGSATEQMFYDNAGRVNMSTAGDGVWKFFAYDANGNVSLTMVSTAIADLGGWNGEYALNILTGSGSIDISGFNQYYTTASVVVYDRRNMAAETYEPGRTVSSTDVAVNTTKTLNTRRWYNAFGEVTQEKNARGYFTNYAYNTMGRLVQVQAPEVTVTFENGTTARQRPTENYAYDLSGRAIATQNANGFWTTRLLLAGSGYGDKEGLVTTEYRPDGSVWTTKYDVYQNVRITIDGGNRTTSYTYDGANRLIQVTRPSGNSDSYAYDGLGQRIKHWNNVLTAAASETTDYDGLGRVTRTKNFADDVTTYTYSWNGALTTQGLGQFGGWTKATARPDGLSSSETNDVFGRMVTRTDLGGRVYTYNYNEAGQLASQTSTAGQNISYTYHNTGRMATMLDNAGAAYGYSTANIDGTYNYDEDGNRTYERLAGTTTYYDPYTGYGYGAGVTTVHQEGRGTYDEMGRLLTFTDAGASGNGAVSITNAYDAAGNVRRTLATHATFAANQTIAGNVTDDYWYKYDALNRMTLVKGALVNGAIIRGTVDSREITYNGAGERATQSRTVTGYSGYQNWAQESREIYTYSSDGLLTGVNIATGTMVYAAIGQPAPLTGLPGATGAGVARAATTYDGIGRVTDYREFAADGVTVTFNRYSIAYDYRNNVTSEASTLRRTESDGFLYVSYSSITNVYGLGGLLSSSTSINYRYKNGTTYNDTPDTSNSYTYANWDAPVQSTITFRPNTSQTTSFTSTYNYDANGHLTHVNVNDGRARTITYINDANGQILSRVEADGVAYNSSTGAGGDPKQVWWFFDGKQVGTTGNNGNDDPDFETALTERVTPGPSGTQGAFRNGQSYSTGFSDFDQAYNSLSPGEGGGPGSAYLVRGGDTLSSIAQAVYGDSSLWYMIADANGLSGSAALVAGQTINIPAKLANTHNTSDTFRPYDAARSIGDTQPTTPKPPKKPKCGVFGQILLAVIAAAVTAVTAGSGAPLLAQIGAAMLGSVVSQGVGIALGIQDKFSFKAVAMAGIGAAVGGGLGKLGKVGDFLTLDKFFNAAVKGALTSAITQGIGVATGLQKKFDWVGVAAAGVGAGVGQAVGKWTGSWSKSGDGLGELFGEGADLSFGNIAGHAVTGMATGFAKAATRSIVEGSDFGDNVLATLPDEIGATLGELLVGAIGKIAEKRPERMTGSGPSESSFSPPEETLPLNFSETVGGFQNLALDGSVSTNALVTRVNLVPSASDPWNQTRIGPIPGYDETGDFEWRNDNDQIILNEVNAFNRANGLARDNPRYLWAFTVKAQIMVESGGTRSEFLRDPMQVNKRGDWAPEKTRITGLTGVDQVMTPTISIRAGLKWLDHKGFKTDRLPNRDLGPRTYRGIRYALRQYNGNTDVRGDGIVHRDWYAQRVLDLGIGGANDYNNSRARPRPAPRQRPTAPSNGNSWSWPWNWS